MDRHHREDSASTSTEQATRIVSRTETGQLQLHEEDLDRILRSVNFRHRSLPVTILCVTGPRGSGKSFYANLLLEYLRTTGNSSWLRDLCSSEGGTNTLHGFPYGNPDLAVPTGVYMWPLSFTGASGRSGGLALIWVLDIHINKDHKVTDGVDPLELYINLICSKIVEIIWKDGGSSNKLCRKLLQECATKYATSTMCTNQTFLYRVTTADDKTLDIAAKMKLNSDDLSFANHVHVWDPEKRLHTSNGYLVLGTYVRADLMTIPFQIFGDPESLRCKEMNDGKSLKQLEMKEFLNTSLKTINEILSHVTGFGTEQRLHEREMSPLPKTEMETRQTQDNGERNHHNDDKQTDQSVHGEKHHKNGRKNRAETTSNSRSNYSDMKNQNNRNSIVIPPELGIGYAGMKYPVTDEVFESKSETTKTAKQYDQHEVPKGIHGEVSRKEARVMKGDEEEETGHMTSKKSNVQYIDETQPARNKAKTEKREESDQACLSEMSAQEKERKFLDVKWDTLIATSDHLAKRNLEFELEVRKLEEEKQAFYKERNEFRQEKQAFEEERNEYLSKKEVIQQQICSGFEKLDKKKQEFKNSRESEISRLKDWENTLEKNSESLQVAWTELNEAKRKFEKEMTHSKQERIQKFVTEAEKEVKARVKAGYENWIKSLPRVSTRDLVSLYDKTMEDVVKTYKFKEGCFAVFTEFKEELKTATSALDDQLKDIAKAVDQFQIRMEAQFKKNRFFLPEELEKRVEAVDVDVSPGNLSFFHKATSKLVQHYKEHNAAIVKAEKDLAGEIFSKIEVSYSGALSVLLQHGAHAPSTLQAMHGHLLSEYGEALKTETQNSKIILSEKEILDSKLKEKLGKFKEVNQKALQQQHKALNSLIAKFKRAYDVATNDALGKPETDAEILKQVHAKTVKEVKQSLEEEIRMKIGPNEPVEVHTQIVDDHAGEALPLLLDEVKRRRGTSTEVVEAKEVEQTTDKPEALTREKVTMDESESLKYEAKLGTLKPSLYPLVAQLSLTGIRLGYWKTESDFSVLEATSIPMVVGLTKENRWACGESAMKPYQGAEPRVPREDLQNLWRIGEYFLSGEEKTWSEQIQVDDSVHEIGLEFLLGMLFLHLKQRTEAAVHMKFGEILATVPFWFTSAHRQQVKDSGTVAGFKNVFIVNENSAAAWGYFKSLKKGSQGYELTVLSENSGLVDITIFVYDPNVEVQTMVGHSGHYKVVKQFKTGVLPNYFKKVAATCPYSESALKEATKDDQTRRYERVREARNLAKEMASRFKSKHSSYPVYKVGIYTNEYPTWKDLLARIATESDSLTYDVSDHLVLLGAGYISQDPSLIGHSIKDRLSLDLIWATQQSNGIIYSGTDGTLSAKAPARVELTLSSWNTDQVQFYQRLMGAVIVVGVLDIKTKSAYHVPIPKLQIDADGGVTFKSLHMKKNGYMSQVFRSSYDASEQDFVWRKGNITEETSTTALSLLEHIQRQETRRQQAEAEKSSALTALLETGNRILSMIDRGEGNFRSDLGRDMIKKQVQEVLDLINHPRFDMRDINKQMEAFKTAQDKYFPNKL